MAELKRVRTGEKSYLKLNAEDYKAWKAAGNKEYGAADDAVDAEPEVEAKAENAPSENKAVTVASAKKARG